MPLTSAQLPTLKTHIDASSDLNVQPNNDDGHAEIARLLNLSASPSFTVWRSNVTIRETGQAFDGGEWGGMTTANHTRLQTVAQYLMAYNAGDVDIRNMFDNIWSGASGQITRANLLVLWKRLATRGEKLYATGTGSDAVPASPVFEGNITIQDVRAARAL